MYEDRRIRQVEGATAAGHQDVARGAKEPDEQGAPAGEQVAGAIEGAANTVTHIDPSALGEELAQQAADQAGKRADTATRTAGGKLLAAAGYLREQEPHAGPGAEALDRVAGGLEHSGVYLQEEGVEGIHSKALGLIREHPVLSLLGACGLGYLLGRLGPPVQRDS